MRRKINNKNIYLHVKLVLLFDLPKIRVGRACKTKK